MIFTILGSGTLVPDVARGPAGFLVQSRGCSVLVDGGTGTVQRLARAGVDARFIDGAVYSHMHVDHCLDLVHMLFGMRIGPDIRRKVDFPIWAGQGFADFVDRVYTCFGDLVIPDIFEVRVEEMPDDGPGTAMLPGGVRLDTLPARHIDGALHLRFTGPSGETVVFSGDTGRSENLMRLADGADLLVCECAQQAGEAYPFHLYAEQVAEVAATSRPRQIAITHLYPTVDPDHALATIGATGVPTMRAFDGQRFVIGE